MMDTIQRFSTKADYYARYRPDFAPEAITAIFELTALSPDAVIADVGSGTGILTRHFIERGTRVYAVEPNDEMRAYAEATLGSYPGFFSVKARAEDTGFPDCSIDLLVAGRAFHWFDPLPTRKEFLRIMEPHGWIAAIWNRQQASALLTAYDSIRTAAYGFSPRMEGRPEFKPLSFYLRHEDVFEIIFPHQWQQDWEAFFGELCSYSHSPDADHPLFSNFEQAAREIFDQFNVAGFINWQYTTQLYLGQLQS
jgi:SAM-dependent methyltransferase